MAITAFCSLNNLSPPPIGSTPITRATELASLPKERSWKNKCLLGLTCAMIGLEMGNFGLVADQELSAVAMDMLGMQSAGAAAGTKTIRVQRWSDRRACQPWKLNSLETIVPENLPRPSARRRREATGLSGVAPPVKVVEQSAVAKGCFSL